MPIILPYIPDEITVHLGPPGQWAQNVTVPFPYYVKNVTSSEIYPTWTVSAIRANILAITSFALNRVYTEHYPSQGYDFQITNTTAYDQRYIHDRSIFENISDMVDELFTSYIRRIGFVEPLAAKFCNGTTTTCDGLSQWGSEELGQRGYDSVQILRSYYGNNIEIVQGGPVREVEESYPGTAQRLGMIGEPVFLIQTALNRVSQNYPAIPKIWPVDGIFSESTQAAVRKFQEVFGLTPDGVVGRATWYQLVHMYVGVTHLSELYSEGQQYRQIGFRYPGVLRRGDSGVDVRTLQYMLAVLAEFRETLRPLKVDGDFGPATEAAVTAFQNSAGLAADGVAGEQTWNRLYREYLGIENYLEADPARFPDTAALLPDPGSRDDGYARAARLGQYPGYPLERGASDEKGAVLV